MTLRLFGTWQNQSLDGIFAERRWRKAGGKFLGRFPKEIADAAGMLPLKEKAAES